ncbi:DEAD/DEAH box helicase [Flavobacterium frigoris]|uniref:Superfamily I DNA and/or RNA helicase n=1 Tax=Flavobacterium frigoris TaxID=229204 RepID=A0A1H9HX34_FLAFI|nr:AAA domain-containing protein [Flavobacterium frigoris]SEQ66858.1 Superfamily I DNA and/or RNA helicase [Flavobacterium frigoris]
MFRDQLLEYTVKEKKIILDQIEQLKTLPEDVQIEKGLLIENLFLEDKFENQLLFSVDVNNSKLKSGDKACLILTTKKVNVVIIENLVNEISLTTDGILDLPLGSNCKLQISIPQLLDPIIELYNRLEEGAPGWFFLEMLAGLKEPVQKSRFSSIDSQKIDTKIQSINLSDAQKRIVYKACDLPSFLGIQGPPGTGKSFTLSVIADILYSNKKRIVIVSHTHQAVNNCLDAIHQQNPKIKLVKIGEKLKSRDLPSSVQTMSFTEFTLKNKKSKIAETTIIGMTIYSAILNLGLRRNSINPNVLLIDEAGQIPLSIGALIGYFGAGSNLFFGDDAQMPPIFQEELISDNLSVSVFQQIRRINPQFLDKLDLTYRMNEELTNIIGLNFYKDETTQKSFLMSSQQSAERLLDIDLKEADEFIRYCLTKENSLVVIEDNIEDGLFKFENHIQAQKITEIIRYLNEQKYPIDQIAIVTPFRKQVNVIKKYLSEIGLTTLPIVDTVERVQGITVDIVIYSVCTTDLNTLNSKKDFIFSPNRINVAISRARMKAIIFGKFPFITNK